MSAKYGFFRETQGSRAKWPLDQGGRPLAFRRKREPAFSLFQASAPAQEAQTSPEPNPRNGRNFWGHVWAHRPPNLPWAYIAHTVGLHSLGYTSGTSSTPVLEIPGRLPARPGPRPDTSIRDASASFPMPVSESLPRPQHQSRPKLRCTVPIVGARAWEFPIEAYAGATPGLALGMQGCAPGCSPRSSQPAPTLGAPQANLELSSRFCHIPIRGTTVHGI